MISEMSVKRYFQSSDFIFTVLKCQGQKCTECTFLKAFVHLNFIPGSKFGPQQCHPCENL